MWLGGNDAGFEGQDAIHANLKKVAYPPSLSDTRRFHLSWRNALRGGQDAGYKRREVRQAIGTTTDYDNPEWQHLHVLLKLKIPIQRDKDIANLARPAQEFAILNACPAQTMNRRNLMPDDQPRKVSRKVLVKQHAHQK